MGVVLIVNLIAVLFQIQLYARIPRHNKHRRSIYGLSYNFVFLTWLQLACRNITNLLYSCNNKVKEQIGRRYPYGEFEVPGLFVVLAEVILFGVISEGLIQLYLPKYKKTRNINQGISTIPKVFVVSGLIIEGWITWCVINNERFSFKVLDCVDFIWFFGNICGWIKLVPQVFMNWFDSSVAGTYKYFSRFYGMLIVIQLVVKVVIMFGVDSKIHWFNEPVNIDTWGSILINLIMSFTFIYQEEIYKFNRPTLLQNQPEGEVV